MSRVLDAQSYQVLGTCDRLPTWQSFGGSRTYVMNSLEYGVNLSRRACRIVKASGVMFLLAAGLCNGLPKPPNHATDIGVSVDRQTALNLDYNIYDLSSLYKNIPTQAAKPNDVSSDRNNDNNNNIVPETRADDKIDKRYPVIQVSFHRVETPFIIGLWIFCASLAKIGKFIVVFL